MTVSAPTYKNHRYPIEIVARAVWLYFRFNLSLRDVEEMLLDFVSYETIRRWCRKHGLDYARRIRRKAPTKDDVWHLDEVVARINGQKCWLRLIRTDMCSTRSFRRAVTPRRPSAC